MCEMTWSVQFPHTPLLCSPGSSLQFCTVQRLLHYPLLAPNCEVSGASLLALGAVTHAFPSVVTAAGASSLYCPLLPPTRDLWLLPPVHLTGCRHISASPWEVLPLPTSPSSWAPVSALVFVVLWSRLNPGSLQIFFVICN
jgi:hypothetical protein